MKGELIAPHTTMGTGGLQVLNAQACAASIAAAGPYNLTIDVAPRAGEEIVDRPPANQHGSS
jgi:hypothetical protein